MLVRVSSARGPNRLDFIADYFANEEDAAMADATRAWNRLKVLDIPKTYAAWKTQEAGSHRGKPRIKRSVVIKCISKKIGSLHERCIFPFLRISVPQKLYPIPNSLKAFSASPSVLIRG